MDRTVDRIKRTLRNRKKSDASDPCNVKALHDAIGSGKLKLTKHVTEVAEFDEMTINLRDGHGQTPLIRACRLFDEKMGLELVNFLMKRGSEIDLCDEMGRTPLSYACENFFNDIVASLVRHGSDPNIADKSGNSPLMYCAKAGNRQGTDILTKSYRRLGLEVDAKNSDGMTPLLISAQNKQLEIAQTLIRVGHANPDIRDNFRGLSAEQWARERGCKTPEVETFQSQHQRSSSPTRKEEFDHFLAPPQFSSLPVQPTPPPPPPTVHKSDPGADENDDAVFLRHRRRNRIASCPTLNLGVGDRYRLDLLMNKYEEHLSKQQTFTEEVLTVKGEEEEEDQGTEDGEEENGGTEEETDEDDETGDDEEVTEITIKMKRGWSGADVAPLGISDQVYQQLMQEIGLCERCVNCPCRQEIKAARDESRTLSSTTSSTVVSPHPVMVSYSPPGSPLKICSAIVGRPKAAQETVPISATNMQADSTRLLSRRSSLDIKSNNFCKLPPIQAKKKP